MAGLLNACELQGKDLKECSIVVNGAGAAGIAICRLFKDYGVEKKNIFLCDSKGLIYKGRKEGLNKYKEEFAREDTESNSKIDEVIKDKDIFIGVSVADLLKKEHIKSMKAKPIVFALANPDPEIDPKVAEEATDDVIIATGRSDYPN